jgi:hypothetical protein
LSIILNANARHDRHRGFQPATRVAATQGGLGRGARPAEGRLAGSGRTVGRASDGVLGRKGARRSTTVVVCSHSVRHS